MCSKNECYSTVLDENIVMRSVTVNGDVYDFVARKYRHGTNYILRPH